MRLAASLAFYTMLSLAPLLVLAIKAVGLIFSDNAAQLQVQAYLHDLMGAKAGEAAAQMIGPLAAPGAGLVATIVSVVVLIVSASAVFGELQDSLNTIWEVKPKPGRALIAIVRERFLSFLFVLGVCFLLLVSLVVTTVMSGLVKHFGGGNSSILWQIVNLLVSLIVVTVLFAVMFKFLPDAEVHWSDVWTDAIATGILFSVGKFLLGWYLSRGKHNEPLWRSRIPSLPRCSGFIIRRKFFSSARNCHRRMLTCAGRK